MRMSEDTLVEDEVFVMESGREFRPDNKLLDSYSPEVLKELAKQRVETLKKAGLKISD